MKTLISKIILFFTVVLCTSFAWSIDQVETSAPIELSSQIPDLGGAYKTKIEGADNGVLVVVYGEYVENNASKYVFDAKDSVERPARDIFVTTCNSKSSDCSLSGNWSTPINISNTALLTSMQSDWNGNGNRTNYYGDSDNPHIFSSGNHVVVTWADKYCPGGYQRSVTYLEFNSREIPMSCMYVAHATSTFALLSDWSVDRLSDGSRDVKQDNTKGLSSGVWAVTWQEDPSGLQPGESEGPGEGSSGAKVSNGTDIWYSYTTNVAAATSDIGVWSTPVRITNNQTGYGVKGSFNPIKNSSGISVDPGLIEKGNTGASRANLQVVGGSSPPNTVIAYEETKGSSGLDEGKFLRYHVFPYNSPPATAAEKAGCIISDTSENARRARFVAQTNAASGSGIRFAIFWRQGLYSQGGPADIMLRVGYKSSDPESTGLNPADLDPPVDSSCSALDYTAAVNLNNTAPLNISSNTNTATTSNLSDVTDANFLENARAHRAVLRANDLYVGYTYTEDGVVAEATDLANYNFYVRRLNASTGVWGNPVNLSNITDTTINVLEPRLMGMPGNGPGCVDPLNITDPEDCQNKNVVLAAWGTETNVYEHIGGSENLDIYITRTTDKAAHWEPISLLESGSNSQGESQLRVTPDGNRIFSVWNETGSGITNSMFSQGIPTTLYSDMAVSVKNIPVAVYAGNNVDITYNVENLGPDKAYDINLEVTLPASVQFLSANEFCTHSMGTVSCVFGSIDAGDSVPVDISVHTSIVEPLMFTANIVSVTLDDPDTTNNMVQSVVDATTGIATADIAVSANAEPDRLREGRHTTITIEITNYGTHAASDAVITIDTPPGWEQLLPRLSQGSCRVDGSSFVCDIGDLNVGASSIIQLDGSVDNNGTVTFMASGSAAEYDPDPTNNDARVVVKFKDDNNSKNIFGCTLGNPSGFDPTLLFVVAISFLHLTRKKLRDKEIQNGFLPEGEQYEN